MYLKSLVIENYRKYGTKNNTVEFVTPYQVKSTDVGSVSTATTLVVGKNNAGKTTITAALQQVVNDENLSGNKFNYGYLRTLLKSYLSDSIDFDKAKMPCMSFSLIIGLDADPELFSINNISDFINVDELENESSEKFITVKVKYEVKEAQEYINLLKELIDKWKTKGVKDDEVKFRDFLELISNNVKFVKNFYDIEDNLVPENKFKISDLLDIKVINASLEDGSRTLSTVFNKIIKYKLSLEEEKASKDRIEGEINNINTSITDMVGKEHSNSVNDVVSSITDKSNMEVNLRSDLNFSSMFSQLINYEFKENGNYIPETQFGLGYKNLMKIIGQLIDYIEQYDSGHVHNKVNIICVEEPENYMHPQMQELFIKNIDEAIRTLLSKTKKKINSQLILTTHSSHILNSKIHTSNSFNNINYVTTGNDNNSSCIPLNDSAISGNGDLEKNSDVISKEELNFLKKHIKFKVSDIFFTDAVILVEGVTEEQLLTYVISEDPRLSKHYICIFNEIPCLVITDLDIKRSSEEKGETKSKEEEKSFFQMTSLKGRETTNQVIKKYICGVDDKEKPAKLPDKLDYYEDTRKGGFKIVYQKDEIEGYYASSFEEAYILTNHSNSILNKTLKEIKPRIFNRIVVREGKTDYTQNTHHSYEWQRKLSSSKSDFANTLIYFILSSDTESPSMPEYIGTGVDWLSNKLNG